MFRLTSPRHQLTNTSRKTTNYVNLFVAPYVGQYAPETYHLRFAASSVSTIVISRFLLDIRAAAYRTDTTIDSTTDFSLSTPFVSSGQGMWRSINFEVKTDGKRRPAGSPTHERESDYARQTTLMARGRPPPTIPACMQTGRSSR